MARSTKTTRRELLKKTAASAAVGVSTAALVSSVGAAAAPQPPFQFSLNTSTIRGQKKPLNEVVKLAIAAGYDGIEPWIREMEDYEKAGGRLEELGKQIEDNGLEVISAIGFPAWAVDDKEQRQAGLEQAKRDMALVRKLGGNRIAAPPAGVTKEAIPLDRLAERYAALLEVGANAGVQPQLELWGHSRTLSRLGEVLYVASESGRDDAAVLPDVFHLYKGGSDFSGLHLLAGSAVHLFHINDYPAQPPRESIRDSQRVFPGDGVAPLNEILRTLHSVGFQGFLSLELFHPEYWERDAQSVCEEGLRKMKEVVADAMG